MCRNGSCSTKVEIVHETRNVISERNLSRVDERLAVGHLRSSAMNVGYVKICDSVERKDSNPLLKIENVKKNLFPDESDVRTAPSSSQSSSSGNNTGKYRSGGDDKTKGGGEGSAGNEPKSSVVRQSSATQMQSSVTSEQSQRLLRQRKNKLTPKKKRSPLFRKAQTSSSKKLMSPPSGRSFGNAVDVSNTSLPLLPSSTGIKTPVKSGLMSPSISRTTSSSPGPRRPYYLDNFLFILGLVLSDPDDGILFNEEDRAVVEKFKSLTTEAQKLYVRLFQRKQKWLSVTKINYPDISDDMLRVLNELVESGLMLNDASLDDFEMILKIMQISHLKNLARDLNVNSNGVQKCDLVQLILRHSRQQRTIIAAFGGGKNDNKVLVKKAKHVLGPCFKVRQDPRDVFLRILLLFSLTSQSLTDDEQDGQQQLLMLLFVNMGKITYPSYQVHRWVNIFRDRDDLINYEKALQLEFTLTNFIQDKKWTEAFDFYAENKQLFESLDGDLNTLNHVNSLPRYLRRYSVNAVYSRCLTSAVDLLERRRNYVDAVKLLELLMGGSGECKSGDGGRKRGGNVRGGSVCTDYRGRWAERLALNLEQHLKQPKKALAVIKNCMKDPFIREGHRLGLYQRAVRICNAANNVELKPYLTKIPLITLLEIPKVLIQGTVLPYSGPGTKSTFVSKNHNHNGSVWSSPGEVVLCSVEELVLQHYQTLGFPEGLHGESSTFLSLFGLLFWDVIYMPGITDVFRNSYQCLPLDLNHDDFYANRSSEIDARLEFIKNSNSEVLGEMVKRCWSDHENEESLVGWKLFRDVEHVKGLLNCISPPALAKVCERYTKNFRFCRSGFPDLVVWNSNLRQMRIVEVKGPNDRLSNKQILWIDFLLRLELNAEVCHVEAVGAKKLKKTKKTLSPKKKRKFEDNEDDSNTPSLKPKRTKRVKPNQ